MNLGVFNKVNLKVSDEAKGMYSEWTSLAPSIQNGSREGGSVLSKLNAGIGKEVALQVVRQLASNLGIAQSGEPSPLTTDREVRWCMEVICYGLTLTLSDHDTIRDCVNVYCEWLSALDSTPKSGVPKPVRDDPNPYARKMIADFRNLFIPRKDEGVDATNKQAVLCHRVLRTLQNLARTSQRLTRDTWESLLLFLLTVNDVLLAPPNEDDDVGDQLCERVLGVLFEVWLLACARCFPSPPLWKTMRESCMTWRHHVALVEQWNRINFALTVRLLSFLYGPSFPEPKISEEDLQLVPVEMSDDCVAQSWFRFLHCIGNPINLCRPAVVSQTDKFLQFAIGHDEAVDPSQHPCLNDLPQIFLKAVKGFSALVDGFLGIESMYTWEDISTSSTNVWEKGREHRTSINEVNTSTPPTQRRLAKSFSVASSTSSKGLPKTSLGSFTGSRSGGVQTTSTVNSGPPSTSSLTSTTSQYQDRRSSPAPNRPKCNSVLHLFGEWLFEAAFVGTEIENRTNDVSNDGDRRSSSLIEDTVVDGNEGLVPLTSDGGYEAGRAEAIGALCRVFCAKKTGEEILPVYLARFYAALKYGLSTAAIGECGETTVAILSNSSDLLRLDLDGVQVLVPSILSALETVLPEKETETKSTEVSKTELRRASIHLLLSMLALPLHYENLPIRELGGGTTGRLDADRRLMTFVQLKPRLVNLLINALQVETDAYNAHMLLGGLLLNVQDSAMSETTDSHSRTSQDSSEPTSNLLSSDSAHALFVRATYLVCHRLISSWKTDLNVSLAALELLMGLARIHVRESDALECKRAVKWLCDYIIYQCWRPPQAHSKDLHSTIVAAFHCCSVWLIAHPYLLRDKDCLYTALEVAELGISGTKSIGKPGEPICMKADKRPKPASMRVRESAEHLLSVILEHVGYFPSECGPESPSSLLDEASLSKYRDSRFDDGDSAVGQFRYFVSDDSIVLALLEEPLGNDQDPQPTVTVVVRGPFGRYAWTMQQRHLPRYRSGSKYHAPTLSRPVPMHDPPVGPYVRQSYFPDTVDRTPEFKVDTCLRPLDPPPGPKSEERDSFDHLLERQYSLETAFLKDDHADAERSRTAECLPPRVCHDFQTARLFLSHFGFVSYDGMTEETSVPTLTALDSSKRGFRAELETLDRMSTRTCDTAHIFYVAAGQRTAEEIVSNVTHESNVSTTFLQFLSSLGWPVDVSHHPGWTGNVATSWRFDPEELTHRPSDTTEHGGSLYNGEKRVLYWADASSEIAFVVPTRCRVSDNLSDDPSSFEASQYKNWYESGSTDESFNKPRSSSEFERQPSTGQGESGRRRNVMRSQSGVHVDLKIVVAWLESFEDHLSFPIDDLLDGTKTGAENNLTTKSRDVFVIFLHELKSGLLRVRLKGPTGRMNLATPLVDGMVLSNKVSGPLIRQTALNMARRRRLDCDMYQPPHVRRRLKIQDITNCYKLEMTRPELLTSLFSNR